jgi:hypothetical protein
MTGSNILTEEVLAQQQGLIEKTSAHRRSIRPTNGGRTVRVWRSLVFAAPQPGEGK